MSIRPPESDSYPEGAPPMFDRDPESLLLGGTLCDTDRDRLIVAMAMDLREVKKKTATLEKAVTGNGRPEDGIQFRILSLERWASGRRRIEAAAVSALVTLAITGISAGAVFIIRATAG